MKKDSKSEPSANLRKQAEALNRKRPLKSSSTLDDIKMRKLIQKLEIHQIGLELQNEELLQAKAQITASAEKYAELYDFAPSGYFTLANNGEIVELNLCGSKMLGKDRTFLKTRRFNLYVNDDSKPAFDHFLDNVFSYKSTETCEVALTVIGDLPMYVNLSGTVSANGEQCFVIATDITDRKKAEEALRETNELFSLFMKHSPIYTFIKEVGPLESRVLKASENYMEMLGITGSEIEGKTMFELFPHELAAKLTADDWKVVSNGEILKADEDLQDRNYTSIKFPITLDGKTLLAGYTIDITERIKREDEIRKVKEHFKAIIEKAPDGIVLLGAEGNFRFISPAAKRIVGLQPSEELTGHPDDYTHPDDLNIVLSAVSHIIEDPTYIPTLQYRFRHKDGNWLWVESTFTNLLADQSVGSILINFRNITDHKQTEDLVLKKIEELELFNNLAVGREIRMVELKQEVNKLSARLGLEQPYDLTFVNEVKNISEDNNH